MRRRRSLGGGFSPRKLFSEGVPGAWYDPSDYSTLFQDSSGATPVTAVEQLVRLMRDKSGNANHATAPSDASRPVLRARYNQLVYSEQFGNANWARVGTNSPTENTTIAPDGTLTADTVTATAGPSSHNINQNTSVSLTPITFSVYIQAGTHNFVQIFHGGNSAYYANFNILTGALGTVGSSASASIQAVPDATGWYRCSITITPASASAFRIAFISSATAAFNESWTAAGTETIFLWGAQLSYGSSSGKYQRIAAATDYATDGFLPYLQFSSDDSFATGNINFSATNKMSVFAGVTKLSDAAVAMLVELSSTTNAGSFYIAAPVGGSTSTYAFTSTGSTTNSQSVSGYAAPITNVLAMQTNIAAPSLVARINGTQVVNSTATQGTGNYGTYPMYIGRRNNASLPFNGRLYSLIVAGKAASTAEVSSAEAWVNNKTGAY
jgi:hypothetical protein